MRDILTTEVMKRLPERLRPNPSAISDAVNLAVSNGWTPAALAEAATATIGAGKGPGVVVMEIRRLSIVSPPKTAPEIPKHGPHRECRDATHEAGCIVCYCHLTTTHFIPTPPPAWWTEAKNALIARTRAESWDND